MSVTKADPSSAPSMDGAAEMAEFVYFQQHDHFDWIRIGWTGTEKGRREFHQKDFTPAAVLPGIYSNETALHRHFAGDRVDRTGDNSTYAGDEVHEYVVWLLSRGHAGRERAEAEALPVLPFAVWSPKQQRNEGRNGELNLFAELPIRERVSYARSDLPQLATVSDEWYTPPQIIVAARRAMGGIDTDPATCLVAQRQIRATQWYTAAQDGLRTDLPWSGAVWLNPPYGRGESSAGAFVRRLIDELAAGTVTQSITCLNIASCTALWFQPIWESASSHLIYRGRPNFWNEASADTAPTKGIILSYFGDRVTEFEDSFKHLGVTIHAARIPNKWSAS